MIFFITHNRCILFFKCQPFYWYILSFIFFKEEGLVPEVIKDLWVESGSLQMSKYTWDMTQNQNEQVRQLHQYLRNIVFVLI